MKTIFMGTVTAMLAICLSISFASSATVQDKPDKRLDQLIVAAVNGRTAEVQRLIDEGVNVNSGDVDGDTALILSSAAGQRTVVEILLKAANVNLQNKAGVSSLMIA